MRELIIVLVKSFKIKACTSIVVLVFSPFIVSHNQNGVIRKHSALVIRVTKIATLSLPPALRVQTAADANVQGTAAAMTNPSPRN